MSSTHQNHGCYNCLDGTHLVDGIYVPHQEIDSLAHTNPELNAWMQVDLLENHCVRAVKIWNRHNSQGRQRVAANRDFIQN